MSKAEHTPTPWGDDLTQKIEKGDPRVKLNGVPPFTDCRILSEENFQFAKHCVNNFSLMESLIVEMRNELLAHECGESPLTARASQLIEEINK